MEGRKPSSSHELKSGKQNGSAEETVAGIHFAIAISRETLVPATRDFYLWFLASFGAGSPTAAVASLSFPAALLTASIRML